MSGMGGGWFDAMGGGWFDAMGGGWVDSAGGGGSHGFAMRAEALRRDWQPHID